MSGFYTGYFTNTDYDKCAYPDRLYESTSPYNYIVSPHRVHNCNAYLTVLGPRGSFNGAGVSTPNGHTIAPAQEYINIDSILSNRNVPLSKCRKGKVNPINVTRIKTKHLKVGNDYLDSQHTKQFDPPMFYRGVPINRFYDLIKDPQANIFYNWEVNTALDAKDNYVPDIPTPFTGNDTVPQLPVGSRARPRDSSWNPVALRIN